MVLIFFYPFLELYTLYYFGQRAGFSVLLIYLICTFIVGINLIKSAGFNTVKASSPNIILEAPFRLMAGVLILVPGFISDIFAVLILIPFIRKILWSKVFNRILKGKFYQAQWSTRSQSGFDVNNEIFDIKSEVIEKDVTPRQGPLIK